MTKVYITLCYVEYEGTSIVRVFTNPEEANRLAIAMKEECDQSDMHFYVKEKDKGNNTYFAISGGILSVTKNKILIF